MTRGETIAYLRWLADQPDGLDHRAVLFQAALLLVREDPALRVEGETYDTSQRSPVAVGPR